MCDAEVIELLVVLYSVLHSANYALLCSDASVSFNIWKGASPSNSFPSTTRSWHYLKMAREEDQQDLYNQEDHQVRCFGIGFNRILITKDIILIGGVHI